MHYLYLITRDDGEKYVGVTNDIKRRMNEHRNTLNGCKNLRGTSFEYRILVQDEDSSFIYSLENQAIVDNDCKLNKSRGGQGGSVSDSLPKGSDRKHSKLTEEQVLNFRNEYSSTNISMSTLASRYGVTIATIREAIIGDTWKHVPGPLTKGKISNNLDCPDKIAKIVELRKAFYSYKEIMIIVDCSRYHIDKYSDAVPKAEKLTILKSMLVNGKSKSEAARFLRCSLSTIRTYLRELDL